MLRYKILTFCWLALYSCFYTSGQEVKIKIKNESLGIRIDSIMKQAFPHYNFPSDLVIFVKEKKIPSSMQARPHISFLFSKNRKYVFNINVDPVQIGLSFDSLTNQSFLGLIGHEQAHVDHYLKLNDLQIIQLGFRYIVSSRFKRKMERATDSSTVVHGLGKELLDFRYYIDSNPQIDPEYKKMKELYYLSAEEIKRLYEKTNNQ